MYKLIYSIVVLIILNSSFLINNSFTQWTQTNGPTGAVIQNITTNSGNILYATSSSHVYRSYNNGGIWELLNPPFEVPAPSQVFAYNSYVYVEYGNGGVFRSADEGDTWNQITELGNNLINSIAFRNDSVYISIDAGVYVSNDNGETFTFYPVTTGLNLYDEMIFAKNYLITSSIYSAVYSVVRSADYGRTWIRIDSGGIQSGKNSRSFAFGNNTLYGSFIYDGIYKSTDFGIHWTKVLDAPDDYYAVLKYRNGKLYAAFEDSIFVTTNSGNNWTALKQIKKGQIVQDITLKGNRIFAGLSSPGVFCSTNGGVNWSFTSNGMKDVDAENFAVYGNYLYSSVGNFGLYRTVNGNSWQKITGDLPYDFITAISTDSNKLYAGCGTNDPAPDDGVYRTTNGGDNWQAVFRMYNNLNFTPSVINAKGSDIMFGTERDGIYRTTNDGLNWNLIGSSTIGINSIMRLNEWLFYSTHNTHSAPFGTVQRSSDNGASWENVPVPTSPRPYPAHLEKNGTTIFAVSNGKLFRSTNYGTNWIKFQTQFEDSLFNCVYSHNNLIFCGTSTSTYGTHYVRYSYDDGITFYRMGDTIPSSVQILNAKGNFLFAGLYKYGIWRCPLSIIVSIGTPVNTIPGEFRLLQNYPNPFNPITKIRFEIPMSEFTTLKIYDMLGREIQTLLNESLKPGTYEATFDGTNFSSGVYFYKLITDGYSETKRMVLIK